MDAIERIPSLDFICAAEDYEFQESSILRISPKGIKYTRARQLDGRVPQQWRFHYGYVRFPLLARRRGASILVFPPTLAACLSVGIHLVMVIRGQLYLRTVPFGSMSCTRTRRRRPCLSWSSAHSCPEALAAGSDCLTYKLLSNLVLSETALQSPSFGARY